MFRTIYKPSRDKIEEERKRKIANIAELVRISHIPSKAIAAAPADKKKTDADK